MTASAIRILSRMAQMSDFDHEAGEMSKLLNIDYSLCVHVFKHQCSMGRLYDRGNGFYRISEEGIKWAKEKEKKITDTKGKDKMSRNRLAFSKLAEFALWLSRQGWEEIPVKGDYEVLRMQWSGDKSSVKSKALIVHQRADAVIHCTMRGESERWFNKWLSARRENKRVAI